MFTMLFATETIYSEHSKWRDQQLWACLLKQCHLGLYEIVSNIIIKNVGFTSRQALILGTPGGAVAACMTLFCGWYGDKRVCCIFLWCLIIQHDPMSSIHG